ncbi:uncharacterized protein LOC119918520 [Micropterus salmoides]|uniref:uncharacterized protein LOC119918520 n=1 Tax=Micropterus salmoides TaxID=27706 RepID=UPI0018ECA234|nr:uncharacterized protein LOC119918520 [Micropterus salmoides]
MDTFVINILTDWQLTDLVERFKEEGIDEESFILLDEPTINQLIPRAGPRLKFLKKFRELVSSVEPAVVPAIPPTISDVTRTATPPHPMEDQAAAVNGDIDLNSYHLSLHKVRDLQCCLLCKFSQDVRQILTGLHDGKEIVESLDEDNVITASQRRLLVRILVSYLVEKFGENPTSETKKALALGLVQSFACLKDSSSSGSVSVSSLRTDRRTDKTCSNRSPCCQSNVPHLYSLKILISWQEIWYTPGRSHRPATGFLEERLRNIRKRLRSWHRRHHHKRQMMLLLQGLSYQPISQVETYMENTAVYRAKWIRENSWTIDQILEEFPRLMTKGMIAQDFLVLHGEAASKLFETWLTIYAEKVLYLARQEGNLTLPLDGLTPDGVGELALRQLPGLLPPTTYKVGRGRGAKVVRHTNFECSLAFVDHKAPGINMVEYLHEAKASKPYPHVLTLGNDGSASQAFVIISGQAVEQETLLQAIDVCFKAFFVFDVEYPKQCEHVWKFMQNVIYEIPGGESKMVTFLKLEYLLASSLIAAFRNFNLFKIELLSVGLSSVQPV